MLALDISEERIEILDRFAELEGLKGGFRAEYGVNQSNQSLICQLTTQYMGEGRCIDLVVDDASHVPAPTRDSCETLFPRIRPGGNYIVEDYASFEIATLNG